MHNKQAPRKSHRTWWRICTSTTPERGLFSSSPPKPSRWASMPSQSRTTCGPSSDDVAWRHKNKLFFLFSGAFRCEIVFCFLTFRLASFIVYCCWWTVCFMVRDSILTNICKTQKVLILTFSPILLVFDSIYYGEFLLTLRWKFEVYFFIVKILKFFFCFVHYYNFLWLQIQLLASKYPCSKNKNYMNLF